MHPKNETAMMPLEAARPWLRARGGKAVCLWCVGKAAVQKNANLHALKHALHTDD